MHVLPLFVSLLLFFSTASASVSVQYPLEDQLPLIARANTEYRWSFSKNSFLASNNGSLEYTAENLPSWLNFDRSTLSFHGTPTQADLGSQDVQVLAKGSGDTAMSSFVIQTTSSPPPKLHRSVEDQFHLPNPSLSSVFLVSEKSALRTVNLSQAASTSTSGSLVASDPIPALRIPPKWSFSVGFEYDTFLLDSDPNADVYYAALQRDGSPLPSWISFDSQTITLDGVTPPPSELMSSSSYASTRLALALHASDKRGYSGASLPFDIYVASHDVSLAGSSLPTINVTSDSSFSVSLTSPADFSGILLDGEPIKPSDITTLEVDTSFYGEWLEYDTGTRTLKGEVPKSEKSPILFPVTIATAVNQTIETNVSLAVVPSYFSVDVLQPQLVQTGSGSTQFRLTEFFSNATGEKSPADVSLSASFDPEDSTKYLAFDPIAATVSGAFPANFSTANYTHVTITFTAYSHVTHSTSHTTLPISLTEADFKHSNNDANSGPHGSKLSLAARQKMLLGLKIAFGIVGGLVLCGLLLAGLRKCAAVPDTAMVGEDGEKAWTAEEKRWYGIGIEIGGESHSGPNGSPSTRSHTSSPTSPRAAGTPLRRIPTGYRGTNAPREMLSPGGSGVMRKGDFVGKVKATARMVSDTYRRAVTANVGNSTRNRKGMVKLVIGKPSLIVTEDGQKANADDLRYTNAPRRSRVRSAEHDPFDDASYTTSVMDNMSGMTGTSVAGSPSFSTDGRSAPSIPRRRPDFAAPPPPVRSSSGMRAAGSALTTPPQAHVSKTHAYAVPLTRQASLESTGSGSGSDGEVAVIQQAERARSIRSLQGRDGSMWSFKAPHPGKGSSAATSSAAAVAAAATTRPRLVPFTSATRVPVPKLPAGSVPGASAVATEAKSVGPNTQGSYHGGPKRVVSQMARVFRSESVERRVSRAEGRENGMDTSGDDLSVGITYVRALGGDASGLSAGNSPSPSFSIAESSHHGTAMSLSKLPVPRMLARANEYFRFRIPVSVPSSPAVVLEARKAGGGKMPGFMIVDTNAAGSPRSQSSGGSGEKKERRMVELSGFPGTGDVGEFDVGIYEKGGDECVGSVVVEVVDRG